MFACYNAFPGYSFLATMALLVALPPVLLIWFRHRGKLPHAFWAACVVGFFLCTVVGTLDFLNYRSIQRAEGLPDSQWWPELVPFLWVEYGPDFAKAGAVAFGSSVLLSLAVWGLFRLTARRAPSPPKHRLP